METEHTTLWVDKDIKREAEQAAAREHVKVAVIMRRWLRKGNEEEKRSGGAR